jgi:hypothetical protein
MYTTRPVLISHLQPRIVPTVIDYTWRECGPTQVRKTPSVTFRARLDSEGETTVQLIT